MSFNNVGHLITSTITTLQHFATLNHTSPNYTSLHYKKIYNFKFGLWKYICGKNCDAFLNITFVLTM